MLVTRINLGLVYFFGIFILKRCRDMQEFGVHYNLLKYSFSKILYYDREFFNLAKKYTSEQGIYGDISELSPSNPA
jgi:hypothetical protein